MHPTTIYEMSVGEHHRRLEERHRDHLTAVRRRERDAEHPAPDAAEPPCEPPRPTDPIG